ncbi:MAG: hypothetical protein LBQ03_01355 [Puniceicoccales bacterium]|nr:hypothetical protein [Puniceicoccales bacterium]
MDTISHKNDLDNVSRPRDRKINLPEDFGIKQTSKTEDLDVLGKRIGEATQNNEKVDDRTMEHLYNAATGKSTTTQELQLISGVTQQVAQHPEVLSEKGQSILMDAISDIAKHRNSDYSTVSEGKRALSEASKHFPQFGEVAQNKLLNNVAAFPPNQDPEWNLEIAANIAHASDNGINDIKGAAQNQYLHLFGNTAQEILSLSTEKQAQFQQAAVELMQKTQFPFKFDADSLREALFVVPENVRTSAYSTQLAEFAEKFHSSLDTAVASDIPSVLPEAVIPEEYAPSEGAVTPVEILPQALPIAPESMRTTEHEHNAQEELEENFATVQAE